MSIAAIDRKGLHPVTPLRQGSEVVAWLQENRQNVAANDEGAQIDYAGAWVAIDDPQPGPQEVISYCGRVRYLVTIGGRLFDQEVNLYTATGPYLRFYIDENEAH